MENAADQEVLSVFLVVDEEVIYEIAPNSVLNIGRLDTNDIVLDDYKVSREHAVLKFSGGAEFLLLDLASTHGTYVNGDRIERSAVNFGDKIQIMGHELTLRREMPTDIYDTDKLPIPKMARSLDRRLKFFGGLNEFALITLVQFLHQEKQSGLLLLELGQNPGPRIYFQEGDIIHVSQGGNLAELLVRQNHAQSLFFYFHHETNFPKRTIEESTPNYLMGLCHTHDEMQVQDLEQAAAAHNSKPQAVTSRIEIYPPIASS